MPRSCSTVLRTAASTSTARSHRQAEHVFVQRLVGNALELALHRFLAHQVHDELEAHLAAHRGLAKDGLDVQQADAAHFQQVLQQRRAAAFQRRLADAEDVHRVVGHEAVAAADEFQPELALAQAALTGEQHAQAQDVHEHAVARGAFGEVLAQIAAHHVDDMACRFPGDEERDLRAVAHGHQAVGRHLLVGDDEHRRLQRHDARDAPFLVFGRTGQQVGHFAPADDLHPVGVDVVQVAHQVGSAACVEHGRIVEAAFRVGVAGNPLPAQGFAVGFEQRLGADGGGFHAAPRLPAVATPRGGSCSGPAEPVPRKGLTAPPGCCIRPLT